MKLSLLLSLCLLTAGWSTAIGLQEVSTRRGSYTLESGKTLRGRVVQVDGSRYQLEVTVSGGSALVWHELENFEVESRVKLLESLVADDDLAAQLEVARYALDSGLHETARKELKRMSQMAEGMGPGALAPLQDRLVQLTVRLIEAYCAAGQVGEARYGVSRLLTRRDSVLTDEQKHALLDALEGGTRRKEDEAQREREAEQDERAVRERERRLDPLQKDLDKGKELRRDGLLSSKSYTAASRSLERAAKLFEKVLTDAAKVGKELGDDPVAAAELRRMSTEARSMWEDVLLADASLDLARGKFRDAMAAVNQILADDPKHQQALAMRGRIELAESDWGW